MNCRVKAIAGKITLPFHLMGYVVTPMQFWYQLKIIQCQLVGFRSLIHVGSYKVLQTVSQLNPNRARDEHVLGENSTKELVDRLRGTSLMHERMVRMLIVKG